MQYYRKNVDSSLNTFLDSLQLTPQQVVDIEIKTKGQSANPAWAVFRQYRLTCSNFGLVLKATQRKWFPPFLFKTLLGEYDGSTAKSIQWGKFHEETAVMTYSASNGVDVQPSGLCLNPDGILGGSPDGLVGDDGLLEVKCPSKHADHTAQEAIAGDKDFCLEIVNGQLSLKTDHNYYHQVQGQLYITGRSWCDFVVWTQKETTVLRIVPDEEWRFENVVLLVNFYKLHFVNKFLPEKCVLTTE